MITIILTIFIILFCFFVFFLITEMIVIMRRDIINLDIEIVEKELEKIEINREIKKNETEKNN